MREILPGVFHWSMYYEKIKVEVSSYYLAGPKVLLDPLLPVGEASGLEAGVDHIVLTNRHHYRDSGALVERYGCTVWCVESGLHEFTSGETVHFDKELRPIKGGLFDKALTSVFPLIQRC